MTLASAVRILKRRSNYGTVATVSDTATQDCIDAINAAEAKAWSRQNWDFSLNERSITTVAAQQDYTLETSDGGITVIYPVAGGEPLTKFNQRRYLKWQRSGSDADDTGGVFGYMHIGRSSDDKLKIRLVRTPTDAGTVFKAWTKKRLTEYAIGEIATNTRLQYFPSEFHEGIIIGALAKLFEVTAKPDLAKLRDVEFDNWLATAWGEENNIPDKKLRAGMSPMIRRRRRARGGTTVA